LIIPGDIDNAVHMHQPCNAQNGSIIIFLNRFHIELCKLLIPMYVVGVDPSTKDKKKVFRLSIPGEEINKTVAPGGFP
jgi:hypothetical protein